MHTLSARLLALTLAPVALATAACGSSTKAGKAPAGVSASATADGGGSSGTTGTASPGASAGASGSAATTAIPLVGADAAQRAAGIVSTPGKGTIAAQPYTPPAISWTSSGCAGGFQCGTLTVPLDYANPSGAKVDVALIRHLATGQRIGSAMVNFGGPGGSGVDLLPNFLGAISSSITDRFDMVSFDPRGVGKTSPVRCGTDSQLDALFHLDPEPVTQAGRDAYAAANAQLVQGCKDKDTTGLLPHVGTEEVARDMDALRTALGETTISYLGYSYGTYLGEIWADLFPKTVRAAVLDGAIRTDIDLVGLVDEQAKGFDGVLQQFFDNCSARPSCTWVGSAGSPAAAYDALHDKVRRAGSIDAGNGRSLSLGELNLGVNQAMYVRSYWSTLDQALVDLGNGDAGQLLDLSDQYTDRDASGHYSNALEANIAVNCLDRTGPTTEQGWFDAATAVKNDAPRLGFAIVYNSLPCAMMPATPRAPHTVSAAGSPPLLVIGTLHDPATPYVWAQSVSKQLASARLLTLNSSGHLASFQGSSCIVNAENSYMVSLQLPPEGTTCQVG